QNFQIPLLIPCGCIGHSTLLCIQKQGKDFIDFSLYNTGEGLKYHYRYKKYLSFQTHLSYTSVPKNKITFDFIIFLLHSIEKEDSINTLYSRFKEIGNFGLKTPPSTSFLDYEQ